MHDAYDEQLTALLMKAGEMHLGSYGAVIGPTYETKAQVIAFRNMGLQAVGMSTIPEVEAARNRGMNCVGMSLITNSTKEDGTNSTSHAEVTAVLEDPLVKQRIEKVVANFFRLYRERVLNP